VDHYGPKGDPLTPGQVHPGNAPIEERRLMLSPVAVNTAVKSVFGLLLEALAIQAITSLGEAAGAW